MAAAPECLISLFAKAPVPGQVKTRLIPLLGAAEAATFHADCVRQALNTAIEARVGPVEICCAPTALVPFFHAVGAELTVSLAEQGEGDLGERMHRALARGLQRHAAMILIGADCPALTAQDLRDAAEALRTHDTVVAPAEDGGYVLIGARKAAPGLFANIRWSTGEVMERTRANLASLGWSTTELRTLWDVDRPEDYERLQREGTCTPR
jgi:rSAM/selenodomain-associated transferase 1